MKNTRKILQVPAHSGLRNLIRKEAIRLVEQHRLLPPANLESLGFLARELIENLNIGMEHLDFAMVLIGNETWRPTVSATPYHRRLLLLPQCLKNNTQCKGSLDELGLICAGCNGCVINDVLNEAEQLGYATLVAEGTTVAVGLVEEGSIDAVIGVSCMPVLQRSFDQVTHAAVPVIGLPLMYDGCADTNLDYAWLLREIRSYDVNEPARPLSVSLLKRTVQNCFGGEVLDNYFPEPDSMEQLAKTELSLDGQRMRPLLALLAYHAYALLPNEKVGESLALIIECFHKASLIHDDIADNSDYRYHQDTLHKREGVAMAINVGDYLIGKGYYLLAGLPVDAILVARCLRIISRSHLNLSSGQGADIRLNPADTTFFATDACEIARLKTGEAVKVALLTGAIAGGAPESELESLGHFSDAFGIAYQIRDDLTEFEEENSHEKILDFPFLIALANEASVGEGTDPGVAIHPRETNAGSVEKFREMAEKQRLVPKAGKILADYIRQCYAILDELQNQKLRLSLYGIMGKIFKTGSGNG